MRIFFLFLVSIFSTLGYSQTSIYSYKLKSLTNDSINLNDFQGKMLLIVNTATDDTTNTQLNQLVSLEQQYRDSGLVILAVPSNDFGNETDSLNVLRAKYAAYPFYVSEPLNVTGTSQCPLYSWLCQSSLNGIADNRVIMDFKKILINREGRIVGAFYENSAPLDIFLTETILLNN